MEIHVSDGIRCCDLNKALYDHKFEIKQVNNRYILSYRTNTCQTCAEKPTVNLNGELYCTQHALEAVRQIIE